MRVAECDDKEVLNRARQDGEDLHPDPSKASVTAWRQEEYKLRRIVPLSPPALIFNEDRPSSPRPSLDSLVSTQPRRRPPTTPKTDDGTGQQRTRLWVSPRCAELIRLRSQVARRPNHMNLSFPLLKSSLFANAVPRLLSPSAVQMQHSTSTFIALRSADKHCLKPTPATSVNIAGNYGHGLVLKSDSGFGPRCTSLLPISDEYTILTSTCRNLSSRPVYRLLVNYPCRDAPCAAGFGPV
ncbi:hypothetical protein BKA70DRAFT_100050 [Coprinopsis sp. MPI-PUGE-AT-0042]|nr:hypothetical protein BKA70DRAFT_100050 [Coprinopsis sp. MPI-PUGE-AT-0042]